jgi:hypothetical protein
LSSKSFSELFIDSNETGDSFAFSKEYWVVVFLHNCMSQISKLRIIFNRNKCTFSSFQSVY